MTALTALVTPFQKGNPLVDKAVYLFWFAVIFLVWQFATPVGFPTPYQTWEAFKVLLFEDGLVPNTWASLQVQLEAMALATVISLTLAYLSAVKGVKPLVNILCALRGVAPVAFVPLLMKTITHDGHNLKIALMTIAIAGFYLTAMKREVESTAKADLDYAYTMRAGPWGALKEMTILGKLHIAYDAMWQNFLMGWAMLVTVEAIVQGGGGIGRLMYHDQRHSNLASLLALIIWSAVIGLAVDTISRWLGRKIFRHVPKEGGQ
jgi:ABC-type nitrate/sulfonate/bicarbonate transport system permease component